LVGLAGGQGSGKSTIAQILKIILKYKYNLNTINFSIDDFYKTLKNRKENSKKIHKLFLTRGAPGTHDILFLQQTFKKLFTKKFKPLLIPRFNKANDNREPKKNWIKVAKKPDIIIFEGWCVGAKHQSNHLLVKPINSLEKFIDNNQIWRKKVNLELKTRYKKVFKLIDKLIFLKVPSFEYVLKWRLLQEKKLKLSSKGKKIMSKKQIKEFVMFYERITRQMIKDLKYKSDILIKLDKKHRLYDIKFN
jgi:D-glycerate 3-kinase